MTIHWIDEGVDTGPIAFQRAIEVTWEDARATLYRKAQQAIVNLFREVLPTILSGDIPRWLEDLR